MKLPKAAITFAAILSSFSLASCNKTELINLAYGSLDNSLKEITYTDLATMVNDEDSFILAITSSSLGCGCWSTFKNQVLLPYQNENHVMIYYINHQEFYDASQKLLDTFGLTITVQNTSTSTAVSNVQFDLKAASEGDDSKNTYEAFLPTSGSSTVYVSKIEKGCTYDINIEMTARGDLTQKPYVINVNAQYEDSNQKTFETTASVSIPVKQEARVDTGDADIMPLSIAVGEQSNIMFDIYNMGKTTLYNVQVSFQAPSIDGGNVFVGKLDPGATGSVDATVTGIAETTDDGVITAIISYEDESGNVSTLEKNIDLFVYEAYYDDGMWEDPGFMYEDAPKSGMPWWGWLLIILAVIGIVTGIIIFIKKKKASKKKNKKKNKNKYAQYEEVDDIEQAYTDESNNNGEM